MFGCVEQVGGSGRGVATLVVEATVATDSQPPSPCAVALLRHTFVVVGALALAAALLLGEAPVVPLSGAVPATASVAEGPQPPVLVDEASERRRAVDGSPVRSVVVGMADHEETRGGHRLAAPGSIDRAGVVCGHGSPPLRGPPRRARV